MNPYFTRDIKNTPVKRRRSGPALSWSLFLSIIAGFAIAYGFINAAQYHFRAMDLGYRSEELKQQRTKLETEQRKLTLELERRSAPQRLDSRAQRQGLTLPAYKPDPSARRVTAAVD